jgi:hypothetical protein
VADTALTPELALEYLQELSTDIRSAVLFDDGGHLAAAPPGDRERAERMRTLTIDLFERADSAAGGAHAAAQIEVTLPTAAVFAIRAARWTLAVVANRYALPSLMFYDLRSVADQVARP